MTTPRRSIFRERAMKHYIQRQEKDVLPRLVSPPVFVYFWILLGLLGIAACVAWCGQVPTYVAGSGVLLAQQVPSSSKQPEGLVLIFLPANHPLQLQIGFPVQLRIDATGLHVSGQIEKLEPGIVSPQEARRRYALNASVAGVITQPSRVLIARIETLLSTSLYAGSIMSAQVQSGYRSVFSLLSGFVGLVGG